MENKKIVINLKNSPVETITLGFVEDAIKLTQSTLIREKIAYNFIKKGWIELETNNLKKALKSFYRALNIFTNRNDLNGYILSNHGIAMVFNLSKKYTKALEIYFEIFHKLDKNSSDLRFILLKDIANTYFRWGNYKKALEYLKKSMNLIKNESSVYRKIYLNYYIGRTYIKILDYNKAQEALFMTLTLCDANGINYKISEALTNLGNIFRKKQNFTRSESFHIRAIQYAKSSRDYEVHIDVLLNLANLRFFMNQYEQAVQFALTALEELKLISNKYKKQLKIYYILFMSYKELKDNNESIKFLQKYLNILKEEEVYITTLQHELLEINLKCNKKYLHNKKNNVENKTLMLTNDIYINDLENLTNSIYKSINGVINFSNLNLFIPKLNSELLTHISINKDGYIIKKEFDPNGSPVLSVINEKKEIIFYNRKTSNIDKKFTDSKLTKDMNSFIIIPIKRGETIVGALSIEDYISNKYTNFDLNTLKILSAYTSLSLENNRIKDEMESLNNIMGTDTIIVESSELNRDKPLKDKESGLPYKELFIELLNQGIKGTKREKGKLAIYTIIINLNFENKDTLLSEDIIFSEKIINNSLKNILRAEDILGKESENTYLLSIKMDSIRGCRVVAKKIISEIKKPIFTENQKIVPSVKIGISIYPDNYLTIEELLANSKRSGLKIPNDNLVNYSFSESIHNITTID